jgi:hypothetical protein
VQIATSADVARFSARFGVLGCCGHELPSAHGNRDVFGRGVSCKQMEFPFSEYTTVHWEPIAVWLKLAAGAQSLLRVASRIYQDEEFDQLDWARASSPIFGSVSPDLLSALAARELRRGLICLLIEQWLALSGAAHGLVWPTEDEVPTVRLLLRRGGQSPTVAILASQLMLAVARASELAVCSGCSCAYHRERRPQSGRRNYCPTCQRAGIANRDRQRSHRARVRGAAPP